MDIPRPKKRSFSRYLWAGGGLAALIVISVLLSGLKPAAPTIDRSGVWVDAVKRGSMLRQVKGPGTLVPEHTRWITADTAGRVERIHLRPGTQVTADTVLLELSNPDVMLQALESERQLAAAEAELINLKSTLEAQKLQQQQAIAQLKAEHADTQRRAAANRSLLEKNMVSDVEARQVLEKADELSDRLKLEQQRLGVTADSQRERLAAQRAQIDKLKAVAEFRRKQVDSLHVRAGGDGTLSELPLELGQWVTPGLLLAKVVQPDRLKAELRIAETQAKDLTIGQPAEIDTRNGVIPGKVARIAPSASQGTVLVEVALEGPLPKGARPDLTVEGTVQIERLENVLYVGRPAGAQPDANVELFKLQDGDSAAVRVKVRLGKSSVNTIEVRDGLVEGDKVVLSDMSAWDSAERVRLK